MLRRKGQPDLYALLQVSAEASSEQIADAYRRLQDMYSADRLAEAAPEFQEQAAARRTELETAFHELGDPQRRADYDRRSGVVALAPEAINYRPLPPARAQERNAAAAGEAAPRPLPSRRRQGARGWAAPIAVAVVAMGLLLLIVLSGVRTFGGATAVPTPALLVGGQPLALPYSSEEVARLRAAAEADNTSPAWIEYANARFDNLQTLRENAPQSPQYRNVVGEWLDVARAYESAIGSGDDPVLRSDRAVALFNYGVDAPDPERRDAATAEAEQAAAAGVSEPRAALNYGLILALAQPPRSAQAVTLWQAIVDSAPQSPEAERARALIGAYGSRTETD